MGRGLTKKNSKDAFYWDYNHHGNRHRHKELHQSPATIVKKKKKEREENPGEYSVNQHIKKKYNQLLC